MTSAARSTLRPAVPSDLPAISVLLSQAFKTSLEAPSLDPAMMHWKYWDARPDWSEPRAYLLEKHGRVAAFAGICPLVFGAGENAIRGIHMIDWAAAGDSPGAGLTLVKKLADLFDFILAIGGSEATLKVLPALGFVECAQAWRAARPLRPVLEILTHQSRNWKLAPRLLRNLLLMTRRRARVPGFRTRLIAPTHVVPGWLSSSANGALFSPRSPEFFDYLLRCPGAPFGLHSIESDSGNRDGCFVLSVVRRQARLGGIWLNSPRPLTFRAAYSLARQIAAAISGTAELVIAGSGQLSACAAAAAGFQLRGRKPVLLLNRTKRFQFSPDFQFQLLEDDEAWLDTGSPAYWT